MTTSRTAVRSRDPRPLAHGVDRSGSGTVVKRSVSLDAAIDKELTRRFGAGGKSRFLNAAARDALARLQVSELLARYDDQDGAVPPEFHEEVAKLPRPR